MEIKLTIGTAVYNVGEKFLRESIESVKKQLTDETEFLLIDDCSTDNSGDVCREYAEEDSRIRYIRMEQNGGLSLVRNRTIEEARGKWICFADGDDLLSDNYIETALALSDEDFDIITYDKLNFENEKGAEKKCDVSGLFTLPENAGRELSLSCLCLKPIGLSDFGMNETAAYHGAWGALYLKSFLVENGLIFPAGQKKAQDAVFNTAAYFCAGKIAYLPYPMYYYRKNLQGITQRYSSNFVDMAKSLMAHENKCIEKYYRNDEEVKELYKRYKIIALATDSMRLNFFHKDNPNPRKERKKEFSEFIATEPFKSAIENYDLKYCDSWDWRLVISLAKKKNFGLLDFAFAHKIVFRLYGGINCRLKKLGVKK